MTSDDLRQILKDSSSLTQEHLQDLIALSKRCPSTTVFHLLILRCMYKIGDLRFATELQRRALYIPDLRILHSLLQEDMRGHKGGVDTGLVSKREEEPLDAFALIDDFLADHPVFPDTDSPSSNRPYFEYIEMEAVDEIEQLSTLPSDDSNDTISTLCIIDDFLKKGEEAEQIKNSSPQDDGPNQNSQVPLELDEGELYTETLARIYIKQGKYASALRIIKSLYLKYPKKSSYFAEQISFLERLVANS